VAILFYQRITAESHNTLYHLPQLSLKMQADRKGVISTW